MFTDRVENFSAGGVQQLELPGLTDPVPSAAPERVLPAGELLLRRLRAAGLSRADRCVLTTNRSVLVSLRGEVIRIHRSFVAADDAVLRAVATFLETNRRTERLRARRVIVNYPVDEPEAPPPVRTHPADAAMLGRLVELHAVLNRQQFGGSLGEVSIRISRRMRSRLGHFAPARRGDAHAGEIALSRRHIRRDGWAEVTQTLLHEMVHQWQHENALPLGHGRSFREMARKVGADPSARRSCEVSFDP